MWRLGMKTLSFETAQFRYRYESPKTPDSTYDHDMNTWYGHAAETRAGVGRV